MAELLEKEMVGRGLLNERDLIVWDMKALGN